MTMKLARGCVTFILLTAVSAFSGPSAPFIARSTKHQSSTSISMDKGNDNFVQSTIRAFGVAATFLAFNTASVQAFAETPCPQCGEVIYSSSMQLSETIKTMDFSLPSSYDSLSDAKASGVEQLADETSVITGNTMKKTAPAKKEKAASNKGSQALTAEEKAQIADQKRAEREAIAAEKAALEAEKAAEKEAVAAAKQAEKEQLAAERATAKALADAERAEKQKAAKAAKELAEATKAAKAEEKAKASSLKGADFVDMGLPSYGESTSQKQKNAFSI